MEKINNKKSISPVSAPIASVNQITLQSTYVNKTALYGFGIFFCLFIVCCLCILPIYYSKPMRIARGTYSPYEELGLVGDIMRLKK